MSARADKRGLARLMLQWPRSRRQLESQYDSDADLRSLCAAYEEAHAALEVRRRRAMDTAAEMSDYDLLIGELESDIRLRLPIDKMPPAEMPNRLAAIWRRVRYALTA